MLKIGLEKKQSVLKTNSASNGCGCGNIAKIRISQKEKEERLQVIANKMNKNKNSIYKTKAPIF
jgi:hypothetical protein